MVMMRGVGVEIALPHVDHDLAQQPDRRELMQRVVYGRERDRDAGSAGLMEHLLGRDVSRAALEQELGKGQALARRPQARRLEPFQNPRVGSHRLHLPCYLRSSLPTAATHLPSTSAGHA